MKCQNVVNRLKQVISKYTTDFSNIIEISELSISASLISATTAEEHNLTSGDYVTIKGAKEPISISSITRNGSTVTVITNSDHKLSDPSLFGSSQLPLYVELDGNSPVEYNGSFELISVPDSTTFTYKIDSEPDTPAVGLGFLLLPDFDGYNGYKQVTVTSATTFTYDASGISLQSPAQGDISLNNAARIAGVASPTRIIEFYDESDLNILENWMFVNLEAQAAFRDGTTANDISSAKIQNEDFWYSLQQNFSIYVVVPSRNSLLGVESSDLARSYYSPILKAIANYQFESDLVDIRYQPAYYLGDEPDDYIKAYYVHRFDFAAKSFIQIEDTADEFPGVPLQLINGQFIDKDLEFKPIMR